MDRILGDIHIFPGILSVLFTTNRNKSQERRGYMPQAASLEADVTADGEKSRPLHLHLLPQEHLWRGEPLDLRPGDWVVVSDNRICLPEAGETDLRRIDSIALMGDRPAFKPKVPIWRDHRWEIKLASWSDPEREGPPFTSTIVVTPDGRRLR